MSAHLINRRRILHGLAATGTTGLLPALSRDARAANPPQILRGSEFKLTVEPVALNVDGVITTATGVNGSVPAPTLIWQEGDTVSLAVTNRLSDPSSIHWHGVRTPSQMDGVPGLSFTGIPPGETFVYRFPVHQSGTYWYHSHSMFQEQTGLYGSLIIAPKGGYTQRFDRDYVVVLSDWSFEAPETILSNLKQQSDYYNHHKRTLRSFVEDARKNGLKATVSDRVMWGQMRMSPTDILDVSGATYTYLMNGQGPLSNWTALYKPGERVRLRFINASSMSIFDIRIPGLKMSVVQADGNDVMPVEVDEFRISVAETYDVIVSPTNAQAFTIFAQVEDRTGYARGTLAPHPGMAAAIPPMDPPPLRTMKDMGMQDMNMQGMDMAGKEMAGTEMAGAKMAGMDHSAMKPPAKTSHPAKSHMDHTSMPDMGSMDHMAGMHHPATSKPHRSAPHQSTPTLKTDAAETQQLENRVAVDNVAMIPSEALHSPGEGFPKGRRVLAYTDLRALKPGRDARPPGRTVTLHLTGNMERFIWGFDGKKYSEAEPIEITQGERIRFVLINDSMMEHPIHLHGLWSELENGHGAYRPYKHTINVKPGERLSYLVTADEPGRWAFHCHLLYHMELGMFREVRVI